MLAVIAESELFAAATLRNIVGAAIFAAALCWYVYLRGPLCVKK